MEKAEYTFKHPIQGDKPSPSKTRLWAKCEEAAGICYGQDFTYSNCKRFLRYGYDALDRAIVRLGEANNVRNKAAMLIFFLKNQ